MDHIIRWASATEEAAGVSAVDVDVAVVIGALFVISVEYSHGLPPN